MAEVRFKIKGQEQETVFSPVQGENGVFLYGKVSTGDEKIIPLKRNENNVFELEDTSIFEESEEVIEERLLGLSEEWMSEALFKVGMCLPAGPYVTDEDVRYIVESIKEAIVG